MDFKSYFSSKLNDLKDEGRYRIFADLERQAGNFPRATRYDDDGKSHEVTVWCSNDYLGMGQHSTVQEAMKD
ncbi:MAG: 5-aminolevulinate synthase, partial [Pseudomonadota bacterium]